MNQKYFCFIQTMTLILCCISYMLVFFYRYTPSVLTDQLSESLNVTKDRISVFSSMYFWTYAAMQPIGGILSDVLSPGKLIALSTIISATGSIIMGESTDFILSCFARCLVGIGCGPIFVCSIRLAANWYSPKGYAIANGIILTMGSIGGCLAQGPLSTLCDIIDWRWAFRISTIIGFFVSIICFFFIKTKISDYGFDFAEYHNVPNNNNDEQREKILQTASLIDFVEGSNDPSVKKNGFCSKLSDNLIQSFKNLRVVVKTPQVYVFIVWDIFAPSCYYNLAGLWGSRYLQEVMKIKKKEADYWILVISLSVIVGGLIFPQISNWVKSRKWVLNVSTIIGWISALGFVFIDHNIGSWLILILIFLFGLGSNGNITILNTLIKETNYDVAGTMLGFVNFFPFFSTGILQILSPIFINWAEKDKSPAMDTHSPRAYQLGLWLTSTAYLTVSSIATFFIKETYNNN